MLCSAIRRLWMLASASALAVPWLWPSGHDLGVRLASGYDAAAADLGHLGLKQVTDFTLFVHFFNCGMLPKILGGGFPAVCCHIVSAHGCTKVTELSGLWIPRRHHD